MSESVTITEDMTPEESAKAIIKCYGVLFAVVLSNAIRRLTESNAMQSTEDLVKLVIEKRRSFADNNP